MAHPAWPLFDLVVRTPRLELRHPDDEMCFRLAELGTPEIFPEGESQFHLDWTGEPPPLRQTHSMQWWWGCRSNLGRDRWHLTMAVVLDGEPVGCQDLGADRFPLLRSVTTGSWLARHVQGRGLGREMREAVLHLAFEGLGALEAHSSAFVGNERSQRVSRALGYADNGEAMELRGTTPTRSLRYRLSREAWAERRRGDIEIDGLEPCLALLGL